MLWSPLAEDNKVYTLTIANLHSSKENKNKNVYRGTGNIPSQHQDILCIQ